MGFDPFCRSAFFAAPPIFWPMSDYYQQPYPVVQQVPVVIDDTRQLELEVARLREQVNQMSEEHQARATPAFPAPVGFRPEPPTILLFRDGHRLEVQNYGIAGETLWIFTEQHARKVPLSEIDLAATQAENEERGVRFALPKR